MNLRPVENSDAMAIVAAVLTAHIKPLLPGAAMSGPYSGGLRPSFIVCYDTKHRLRIYASPGLDQYFVFERSLPFSEEERSFVEGIVGDMHAGILEGKSAELFVADSVTRAVVRRIAPELAEAVLRIIRIYETWRTHENHTAHTTGIRMMRMKKTSSNFFALAEQEAEKSVEKGVVKALGTSPDTLVVIDPRGDVCGIERVPIAISDSKRRQDIFAPVLCANIAVWANSWRKATVRLTEDGTILLFSKGRLLFVKRKEAWWGLPHTLISLDPHSENIEGVSPETAKAVYLTALDMAPTNCSASIGLVRCDGESRFPKVLRKMDRRFPAGDSSKNAKLLAFMTNNQKFHEIPRTIRAEICALGGTLFVDGGGTILGLDIAGGNQATKFHGNTKPTKVFPGSAFMEICNQDGHSHLHLIVY